MKIYYLAIILLMASCQENKEMSVLESNNKIESNTDTIVKTEYLTIREYDLRLYNEGYLLRITPEMNYNQTKNTSILMKNWQDTLFNKVINIDSLQNKMLQTEYFKSMDNTEYISRDYYIDYITYHGVRTDDIYFHAYLQNKVIDQPMKIKFQLSYSTGNMGKLFVNGLYPDEQTSIN